MSIDWSKIKAANRREEAKKPQLEKAERIDFVALQKEWADEPSYWVELLQSDEEGLFFLKRSWSFWSKKEGKLIEGEGIAKIRSLSKVKDLFISSVKEKFANEYKMVSRHSSAKSPVHYHDLKVQVEEQQTEEKPTALGRKGSFDLW